MRRPLVVLAALVALLGLLALPGRAHAAETLVYDAGFNNVTYTGANFVGCTHNGCPGAPMAYMGAQPAGEPDNTGHCTYDASQVVSVHDGYLDLHAHADSAGRCWSVNLHPLLAPMTYGQYEMHFRADDVPGFHFVALLWPANGHSGEIDGPEANLGNPWHGFVHPVAGVSSPGSFDIYVQSTVATGPAWHYWTVTWAPGGITMQLDGRTLPIQGHESVPNTPMFMAIHLESDMGTSVRPPPNVSGHVLIDWLRIWRQS